MRHGLDALGGRATPVVVAGYLPIRSELDPRPLMAALHRRGATIAVPVIVAKDRPLRFRRWVPRGRLVPGLFGVAVPAAGPWLRPDVLLVPLLAFDRSGRRLGYGGGFYDRTLAARARQPGMQAFGIGYRDQMRDALPASATDIPLRKVITERGVLHLR